MLACAVGVRTHARDVAALPLLPELNAPSPDPHAQPGLQTFDAADEFAPDISGAWNGVELG